jgi:GT2 family glycosyltransferase
MNAKISVIIPTKNRTEDVIRCLESITIQTILPDEVVIVDSSDTEELKSTFNSFDDLNIKYIRIEVDKKFKGSSNISRNRGIDNSTGDIIILVDDDVILDKEYIRNIMHVFNNDLEKKVGGVIGEIIENAEPDKFIKKFYRFAFQTLATIFFLHKYGDGRFRLSGFPIVIKTGSVNDITNVEYLCGCSIAFRKEVIKEFRFDEKLNIHGCCFGDDDDVAYRISRKYQNIYTPFAKLIHNQSPVRANKYAKNRLI